MKYFVVGDELDVLSVPKLVLKAVKVYGLPIKVHTAKSKAEATELLGKPPFTIDKPSSGNGHTCEREAR